MSKLSFEAALARLRAADLSPTGIEGAVRQLGFNHPTHFGDFDFGGLELQQVPSELAGLLNFLLNRLKRRSVRYLEIGVGSCATIIVLDAVLRQNGFEPQIFGVDSLLYGDLRLIEDQKKRVEWAKQELGATFCIADTSTPAFSEFLDDKLFDVILVDGEHTYQGCMREFFLSLRSLAPDGLMVFHDVRSAACPGVVDAFETIRGYFSESEVIAAGDQCGIGICHNLVRLPDPTDVFRHAVWADRTIESFELPETQRLLVEARGEAVQLREQLEGRDAAVSTPPDASSGHRKPSRSDLAAVGEPRALKDDNLDRLEKELARARSAVATQEQALVDEKRRALTTFLTTKLAVLLLISRFCLPRLPFIRRLLHRTYFGQISFHLDRPRLNAVLTRVEGEILVSGWVAQESSRGILLVRSRIGRHVSLPELTRIDGPGEGELRERLGGPRYNFTARVAVPDGVHRLSVEVRIGDAGWIAIYNGFVVSHARAKVFGTLPQLAMRNDVERRAHVEVMPYRPAIAVLIDNSDPSASRPAGDRLGGQVYPAATVEVTATPWDRLQALDAEFVVVLATGDRPTADMLYAFADALNADRSLDVIYGDEMCVTAKGERLPFWKPDWSPDYLESLDYIGRPVCIRRSLLVGCTIAGHYDLVLQATERTRRIGHVRAVLLETRPASNLAAARAADIAALKGRLARTGRSGRVEPLNDQARAYRTTLDLAERPLVSIVIPTAGRSISLDSREIDLITNCVRDIRTKSTYPNYEIIVVDNADLTPDQIGFLTEQGCRLVSFMEDEFNVAKKLNLGVAQARGEFVLLLNDDIEIISTDWIERMADHLAKPHVGVVGAKLLYTDDTIQHAGVVFYHGNPDHVRRKVPRDDEGYFYSTAVARNFIAVTGACMLTRTALYRQVGGYTEELAVSYNDADFCFKLAEAGYATVYEPSAELYHFESKSRTPSLNPDELAYYQTRWAGIVSDPYYNDLELTVASPTFELCSNARLV